MEVSAKLSGVMTEVEPGPPSVDFGRPYGGVWGHLPDGTPFWAFRKGLRVRLYDIRGNQLGPEQSNAAPAMAYAARQPGWRMT